MRLDKIIQRSPLHKPALHESGYRHTSGEARYVDDFDAPPGTLYGWVTSSPHAHARITGRSASRALQVPGVTTILFAADVPGDNHIGPILHDEPVLAEDAVHCCGQAVALVLADSLDAAIRGAEAVEVEYEPLAPILDIRSAIAASSFHTQPHVIARGDVDAALAQCAVVVRGDVGSGAQDHFYLETQAALSIPDEDGTLRILSSSQHPTEVQRMAASVLGIGQHRVVCEVPRLGGGFGGKESQATQYAVMAGLGSYAAGKPVRIWLNREADMRLTGKRHPFWSEYEAGFDLDGRLRAFRVHIYSDGGWTTDLSEAVMDRALFHLDNAYFIEHLEFTGRVCKTNLPSNTAFRGFGGPQGMIVVEDAINRAAERLGLDPAALRERSLYGEAPRNAAPYGQVITDNRLPRVWPELMQTSDYAARRKEIEAFNRANRWVKRGIGAQPVKFGISFTASLLNQAGALVLVFIDGTVQLNHGGTEMGQGLHTKMMTVCAHELGVHKDQIRVMTTATDKVPNTSPTAASSGSDLNGQAVRGACATLRDRMAAMAVGLLGLRPDQATELVFADGRVGLPSDSGQWEPDRSIAFAALAKECWIQRVSLAATGFYRTPGIEYDPAAGRGTPFFYFAYGAAVCEVEVHGLTGEHRLRRVDILHDVGDSLVPSVDRGQVEGGFVQGYGWLTCEEVLFDGKGRPLTTGPSTYKIPAVGDAPLDFRVALLERAPQPEVVGGSKAVGEPPLMLAIGAITALRHAIGGFAPAGGEIPLALPATPEAILRAISEVQAPPTE